jgi:hypothetical protein
LEIEISKLTDQRIDLNKRPSSATEKKLADLRLSAQHFRDIKHDPTPSRLANAFSTECCIVSDADLLRALITRDGKVLQLRGNYILPGTAFRSRQTIEAGDVLPDDARDDEEGGAEQTVTQTITLPAGISRRINNLFLCNKDMKEALDQHSGGKMKTTEGVQ